GLFLHRAVRRPPKIRTERIKEIHEKRTVARNRPGRAFMILPQRHLLAGRAVTAIRSHAGRRANHLDERVKWNDRFASYHGLLEFIIKAPIAQRQVHVLLDDVEHLHFELAVHPSKNCASTNGSEVYWAS